MANSIITHLTYNTWANAKVTDVLREVSDDIYFHENKSSFPSIAKTILHIWGAQDVWLNRLKGVSLSAWPQLDKQNTRLGSLDGLVRSSAELHDFVKSKGDGFLTTRYAYKNLKGDPFEDKVEDTLFHIVNHGSYHRGQITTMLREANIEKVASTDLIHYLRTLHK